MVRKKIGRRKGRKSKGFFYRTGRGWFSKVDGRFVPLEDVEGERLRDRDIGESTLQDALSRLRVQRQTEKVPESAVEGAKDAQVGEVIAAYLNNLKFEAGDITSGRGQAKTYADRGQTLYDFCYGLPGEFFCLGNKDARPKSEVMEKKRIHQGYGRLLCSELTPSHIDDWLRAHTWKPGGRRTRLQAVKRALNYGVKKELIEKNPIKGFHVPKAVSRVTYLTPAQEEAMLAASTPDFAIALKVCIRTGARFGCEFAALTGRHVRDHGDRMEWVFKPEESKTKKLRIILVTDPAILQLVRERMNDGPIFLNGATGLPWNRERLSQHFRRVKVKVQEQGVSLDKDACMYSCRHTYAKRTLEGYWTGKPTSISTLARLMGNSMKVCMDHYLQFSGADNEMLWGSA